jgi:hypothetical protein
LGFVDDFAMWYCFSVRLIGFNPFRFCSHPFSPTRLGGCASGFYLRRLALIVLHSGFGFLVSP